MQYFSDIYEHSSWVAEEAWNHLAKKPTDISAISLQKLMSDIVNAAEAKSKRTLLCNHPDLSGKPTSFKKLTRSSQIEQQSAGLTNCTNSQLRELKALNAIYKNKFQFPFILAVRDRNVTEIIAIFKKRLHKTSKEEFEQALTEVHKIALIRITEIFKACKWGI